MFLYLSPSLPLSLKNKIKSKKKECTFQRSLINAAPALPSYTILSCFKIEEQEGPANTWGTTLGFKPQWPYLSNGANATAKLTGLLRGPSKSRKPAPL